MTDAILSSLALRNLIALRKCYTRESLRAAWLSLSDGERADLRWNRLLGHHARAVLGMERAE